MENTVVQFILDNIFLFLPLAITGIIITLILFFTGKKENISPPEELTSDNKTLFNIRINVYVLVYLFIWIMMIIIGVLSHFLIPTLVGGTIAVIPLIALILIEYTSKKSKVL